MSSSTVPSPAATRRRPPTPVIIAAVTVGLRSLIGSGGLVYFGLFVSADVNPDAGRPSAVAFMAVGLVVTVTILASLPGLLRGRRPAWHVLTCLLAAQIYFSFYKIFVEHEADSVVFLAIDAVVVALLLLPSARRHVSA